MSSKSVARLYKIGKLILRRFHFTCWRRSCQRSAAGAGLTSSSAARSAARLPPARVTRGAGGAGRGRREEPGGKSKVREGGTVTAHGESKGGPTDVQVNQSH